jgi:hypothetical protein
MLKDAIADHFSGNPQAGCRVTYPTSRLFVRVDPTTFVNTSRLVGTNQVSMGESAIFQQLRCKVEISLSIGSSFAQ